MRTDSVNLSQEARNAAAKEIVSAFGENYSKTRNFKGKSNFNTKEASIKIEKPDWIKN